MKVRYHNVCMCTYHHNVKLMLQVAGIKADYKLLLLKVVCKMMAGMHNLAVTTCAQELDHS